MPRQSSPAAGQRPDRRHRLAAAIASVILLSMLAHPGSASLWDLPGWPAAGGSPAHNWSVGWVAPADAGSPISLTLPEPLQGGPVACGEGYLFVLAADQLIRIDPDGATVWATSVGRADNRGLALGPGPDGDLQVYVATVDPSIVWAYAASSGTLLWQHLLGAAPLGQPVVHPDTGTLLVGCEDGRLRGYSPSGSQLFESLLGSQIRSRPAIGPSGALYVPLRGGVLMAVNPDGSEIWRRFLGSTLTHSAAVGPGELVYFIDDAGRASCVGADGTTVYQANIGGVFGSPAVDDAGHAYYLTHGYNIVKLTPGGSATLLASLPVTTAANGRVAVDSNGNVIWAAGHKAGMVDSAGEPVWLVDLDGDVFDLALPVPGIVAVSTVGGSVLLIGEATAPGQTPGTDHPPDSSDPTPVLWQPLLGLSAANGSNGWHVTPPQAWLDFADGPPPEGVTVYLDVAAGDEQWSMPLGSETAPVTIDFEGEALVRWRLSDADGATSTGEWVPVIIDTEPPDVSVTHPLADVQLPLGAALRPELSVTDQTSGLEAIETTLSGVPFHGSCHPGPGQHQLQVSATDYAGNVSVVGRSFTVSQRCSAICLNAVLSGPGLTAYIPPWSRWVTVMVRVPVELAAAGEPEQVLFAGVAGVLVGRLPAPLSSGLRSYLFRFDRDDVAHALFDLAGTSQIVGRLHRLEVPMTWHYGEEVCGATATILYRP